MLESKGARLKIAGLTRINCSGNLQRKKNASVPPGLEVIAKYKTNVVH